jgi:hypothetical protein
MMLCSTLKERIRPSSANTLQDQLGSKQRARLTGSLRMEDKIAINFLSWTGTTDRSQGQASALRQDWPARQESG